MRKIAFVTRVAALAAALVALLPGIGRAQTAEEGYLTGSDGNRLFYRKLGTGQPALVYLHGGPINMNDGGYEIDRLGRGRTLIIIDQRSGGRSELVPDDRLDFQRYVDDVEAVRVHFGLQRIVVAGQSFGAWVAASYAAAHPDRVERLMFWSPAPPTPAFAVARQAATDRFLGEADVRRAADLWSRMAGAPDSGVVPLCREWVQITFRFYVRQLASLSRMHGDYCAGSPAAIRHQNRAMDLIDGQLREFDVRPLLRTLRAPALVMEGSETLVPLDATEEWARVAPDARLVLLPGSGHQTWLEGGDAFFEAVEEFLAGRWPAGARIVRP